MQVINKHLRQLFYKLGERIGEKPVFFIISPIFISLLFATGLAGFNYDDDFVKQFSTKNGFTQKEMEKVDKLFPPGQPGSFEPSRRTIVGSYARVIIEAKDGGTLFRKAVWNEIMQVDDLVHSVAPKWRQNYSSLCGKWDGECFENKFLSLGLLVDQIENGSLSVNYPIMFNWETFEAYVIPMHFGGIKLSNDSLSVESVQAVSLNYFLEAGTSIEQGYAWEQKIIDGIDYAKPFWKHINVYLRTVRKERLAHERLLFDPLPYFFVSFTMMTIFLAVTSMSSDWVRAKPWAGILGVMCTNLGTLAGFGLVNFFGVPVIQMAASVPFIMIGIGVDDTFVIMAAWRQTNPSDPVPKRMAKCFEEAGVSITITTLTDMLSFYVGLMTPVEGIQIFSAYAGTCAIWIYLLQIFLFGGCLAISGRQEAENKHGLFFWMEATPKSKAAHKSKFYQLMFIGGAEKPDPANSNQQIHQNAVMVWFKTKFSTYLLKGWVQTLILLLYLGYIGISTYGLTTLDIGINLKQIYPKHFEIHRFFEKEEDYFKDYPLRVQVLITTPLDYHNKTVQNQVNNMLLQMNATGHIALEYSENWLASYTRYLKSEKLNATDSKSFIDTLRGKFLNGSSSRIRTDVKFNEDFTKIVASRFLLQSKSGSTTFELMDLVQDLRAVADNQTAFQVTVYNPFFATTDMNLIMEKLTFQLMGVASAVVMAVTVFFIPSIMCSFLVFVNMMTTELGLVGIMCFCGISLDVVSLLCMVICIGFAVDFTAHVSYAYITAEGSSEDRIRKAMYALGLPILQGGFSTVLAISSLFLIEGYSFYVMATIICLVIGLATFHGLLVLPVLLLIVKPERFTCGNKSVVGINPNSKGAYDLNPPDLKNQTKTIVSYSMHI